MSSTSPPAGFQAAIAPLQAASGHAHEVHRAGRMFRTALVALVVLGVFQWFSAAVLLHCLCMLLCVWAWKTVGGPRKRAGVARVASAAVVAGAALSTAWLAGSLLGLGGAIGTLLGAAAMVVVDIGVIAAVVHAYQLAGRVKPVARVWRRPRVSQVVRLLLTLGLAVFILPWMLESLQTMLGELLRSVLDVLDVLDVTELALLVLLAPGALLGGAFALFESARYAAPPPADSVPGWTDALKAIGLEHATVEWTAWGAQTELELDGRRVCLRLSTDQIPQRVEVAVALEGLPPELWMTRATTRPTELSLPDPILQAHLAVGGVDEATAYALVRDLHGPLLDCFMRASEAWLSDGWLVSRQSVAVSSPTDLLRREEFRSALESILAPSLALADAIAPAGAAGAAVAESVETKARAAARAKATLKS